MLYQAATDHPIGRQECMTMLEAAVWFNERGGNTSPETLEYHSKEHNFETFIWKEADDPHLVRFVTYLEAERVLEKDPVWLHVPRENGIPHGYITMKRALNECDTLTRTDLLEAIAKGIVRSRIVGVNSENYVVHLHDVYDLYYRKNRKVKAAQRGKVSRVNVAKTVNARQFATDRGYPEDRMVRFLLKNGYLAGVTIKGEGPGRKYEIDPVVADKFIEETEGLKRYLTTRGAKPTRDLRARLEAAKAEREAQPELPVSLSDETSELPEADDTKVATTNRRVTNKDVQAAMGLAEAITAIREHAKANNQSEVEAVRNYLEAELEE